MKSINLIKMLGSSIILMASTIVAAQEINFAGDWSAIYHEDAPERIPGPPLVRLRWTSSE